MKPFLHRAGKLIHFQWIVECSVGKGGQNNLVCDISYIQWYYTLAAANAQTPSDRRAVYAKVSITGACKGTDDDPLVQAITVHQKALNHPKVDGKISVATGDGKIGDRAFFVLRLGARLSDMYPQLWPRLDLIPGCPSGVAETVRACIPRVSV